MISLYCVYVVIFVVFIFAFLPETSSSWESISELVALVILSAPTERLRNISAGINILSVFREMVYVRAAAGDDHLEIMFENDGCCSTTNTVKVDKAY